MSMLSDFLRDHIDGYLFKDIESLMAVPVPNGDGPGGVGYPLVMVVFAGAELLGSLVEATQTPGPFETNPRPGHRYFKPYWEQVLYTDP